MTRVIQSCAQEPVIFISHETKIFKLPTSVCFSKLCVIGAGLDITQFPFGLWTTDSAEVHSL